MGCSVCSASMHFSVDDACLKSLLNSPSILMAQSGSKFGIVHRKNGKVCVDVRFGVKSSLSTRQIRSEIEGMFFYDITKRLEREFRQGAGSSRGSADCLNFREESLSIPLERVLPENFQISNPRMKKRLTSDVLKLARDAAQKFEQSQAIRADMSHAQAINFQPKLSEQTIQSVDACLATVEKNFGRQRVDENGRPLKLHDGNPDSDCNLQEQLPKTDEGVGLCCPMDKIDDSSEAWLSKCRDSEDFANVADP